MRKCMERLFLQYCSFIHAFAVMRKALLPSRKRAYALAPSHSVHYLYVCACWQSVPVENNAYQI